MIKNLIKEILMQELLGESVGTNQPIYKNKHIGRICMIRTYSAGVHFGMLVDYNPETREAELNNAHRVHHWEGACSLSELATAGSKDRDNCRISVPVDEITIMQVIEIIPMTETAIENLVGGKIWKF